VRVKLHRLYLIEFMAENKNSFVVYCDWKATFDALPDAEAGMLIKHMFAYVNDEHPVTDNILINAVFANMKQTLKRNLKSWEKELENKSLAGRLGNLKRWNNDLYIQVVAKILTIDEAETIAKHRTMSHTDTLRSQTIAPVAVPVNVPVSVNVPVNEKEKPLSITVEGEKPSPTTKKPLPIRKDEFRLKCIEVLSSEREKYYQEKEENKKFFEYWTEHGAKDLKMRFEKETSFEISKRLDRWFENVESKRQKINQGGEKLTKFQQTIQNGEAGTLKAIEAIKLRKQQEAQ
jgi:hypothetical protein